MPLPLLEAVSSLPTRLAPTLPSSLSYDFLLPGSPPDPPGSGKVPGDVPTVLHAFPPAELDAPCGKGLVAI